MKNTAIKIFLFPLVVITSIQTMDIDVAPETQLQRALSISDAEDQINALRATVAEGENIQRTNDFMADEYHTPYSLDILQRARYELARRTNIWNNHNELNQAAFNTVSSLYDAILHNAGASNPNDIATEVQRDRFSIAVKISSSDPERALTILQSIDHNPFHLNHLETLNIACMIAENVDTQDRITRLRNLIPLIRVMVQRGTHYNIESMSDFRPASALLQDSCFDLGDLLINSADGDVASFYEGIKMLEECADLDTDEHIDELIFLRASRSLPPLLLDCVLYDPNFLGQNLQRIDRAVDNADTSGMDDPQGMHLRTANRALDIFLAEREPDAEIRTTKLAWIRDKLADTLSDPDELDDLSPLDEMHTRTMLANILKDGNATERIRARQLFTEARALGNEEVEDEINTKLHETISAPNGLQHLERRFGTHQPSYPGPMSPANRDIRRLNYLKEQINHGLSTLAPV